MMLDEVRRVLGIVGKVGGGAILHSLGVGVTSTFYVDGQDL